MKRKIGMQTTILYVILGFVLYIAAGAILPFALQPEISEETGREVSGISFTAEGTGTERVMILAENGQALEERIRLISGAKERIVLSTYEFRADESGKDMLAALLNAAQRGVSVQILLDGMAATIRLPGNGYFSALSALENAQIKVYNPVTVVEPWKLMGRMHDKYLMVDDTAYILGGRNVYDFFLGEHDGYKNYDWDVLVYQDGPGKGSSMEELLAYSETVWNHPLSKLYHDDTKILERTDVRKAGKELEERYAGMQEVYPLWFEPCDYVEKTIVTNQIRLLTNPIHCYAKEPVVFYAMTQLMGQAKTDVRFHTPYIICNDTMLERLKQVCSQVPEVVMMTNSVANNGNPFGSMDYEKYKGNILETGVKILEYDGGVSYHGKCFVADERLSGIGSFNWDMRSAYINTELMLVIDSAGVNTELRSLMKEYEEEALVVIDKDSYAWRDTDNPQELSLKRKVQLTLMRIFIGWTRFLM